MAERDFVPPKKSAQEIIYPRRLFHALEDGFGLNPDVSGLSLVWFQRNGLLKGLMNYYHGNIEKAVAETEPFFVYTRKVEEESPGEDLESLMRKEFAREELLSWDEEIALAQLLERGRAAQEELITAKSNGGLSLSKERKFQDQIGEAGVAGDYLYQANLRLVMSRAKFYSVLVEGGFYSGKKMSFKDLCQEGVLGLGRAVEKYEWRKGYRFSTYATWWINQTMTRAISQRGGTIRIPIHLDEKLKKVNKALRILKSTGGDVSPEAISCETGFSEKEVKFLLEMKKDAVSLSSLDAPIHDHEETTLLNIVDDSKPLSVEDEIEQRLIAAAIYEALDGLSDRKREIIELRYLIPREGHENQETRRNSLSKKDAVRTLDEVGEIFGLSRERIRQLEKEAKRQLRVALKELYPS